MSGGVDSSLAAHLLVEQGYDVIGVTMKLWGWMDSGGKPTHESNCCSLDDINNAKAECAALGIPHYTLDMSAEFKQIVIKNFVSEYKAGRTPNPCIICNTEIKWHLLLDKMDDLGVDYLATGHYARKIKHEASDSWVVARGKDSIKDQSYVLWGIQKEDLAKTLFPLGDLSKKEVRALAGKADMRTADTPESMEICFVPDNDYRRFIGEQYPEVIESSPKGDFVDSDGEVIGEHQGVFNYTVGQRKGLGLATGERVFVNKIDVENNTVHVGSRAEAESTTFTVNSCNWLIPESYVLNQDTRVQIRYNHDAKPATITRLSHTEVQVVFHEPEHAITPGQSAVFFLDDAVVGGGVIHSVS
ncbi:MAG: tRNA 2-thiouridine(34) synthase MnmA [Candidatus Marinimicrobia bacterium]|nr:tRNA 2-thiouridine(34) synthase MnmA [Candidatus Neomarinimicrobiota bacterium]MCF7851455.1 tRNA 2-thiouridine(34) synthase MnmA [Candidatus Neomarinimicrobiota bacterium]MCF7904104.1 tRNA 2-thiouridine(34) synthase MnmA [Candidatus Neomarinimicrobiota bacterium]